MENEPSKSLCGRWSLGDRARREAFIDEVGTARKPRAKASIELFSRDQFSRLCFRFCCSKKCVGRRGIKAIIKAADETAFLESS